MKYLLPIFIIVVLLKLYQDFHPTKVMVVKDDPAYTALLKKVREDSAYRAAREAHVQNLQAKIDSLTKDEKRFRALPIKKLDSIAQIHSVRRDSLVCTDEKTYRELVISKLNFGEKKYSLCLGELAEKDSIIHSFDSDLGRSLQVTGELNEGKKEIALHLESVKSTRHAWFLSGIALGIGASLLTAYLTR